MFLHVTSVVHKKDYVLELQFNDGARKEINLEPELLGTIFTPLKNIDLFKQVFIDDETRTISWPNGADFAPEFLYEIGTDIRQAA